MGSAPPGLSGGGMMQVILPEFVDYPQLLHALDYYAPSAASPSSVLQIRASVLSGRRLPPSLLPIDLDIPGEASRVQHVGLQRNAVGGVFLVAPSALCGSPTLTWSKTG